MQADYTAAVENVDVTSRRTAGLAVSPISPR